MAMTAQVKAELATVKVTKPCCRRSEVAAILRFAGGLHIHSGRILIEAELDTGAAARRLRTEIGDVFGHSSDLVVVSGSGIRRGTRYVVRVIKDGEALARQTGLIDSRGRPARGLPAQVVSGGLCDCVAAWRGAFLAHGSLTEPGRSMALEVTCPGPEAALALVGAARRLGISAKAREVRNIDRVVLRDGDAIAALLTRLGAHESLLSWEERRMRREVKASANRLANFDDANLRRSARAAVAAGAGDTRRRRARSPARCRCTAHREQASQPGGTRSAPRSPAHQGRRRGPDPPPAGHRGPPCRRARHTEHRSESRRGPARGLACERRHGLGRPSASRRI
jgi:cell division protein WhiA